MNRLFFPASAAMMLAMFALGWFLSAADQVAVPSLPVPSQSEPSARLGIESQDAAVPTSVPVERESTRCDRTPVSLHCSECERKDQLIAKLTDERDTAIAERTQLAAQLAALQRQLDLEPLLQCLSQALPDWHTEELQSVLNRSKLFPQNSDLLLAHSMVRTGQLSSSRLLALAEEAGKVASEKGKALLYSGEEKQAQISRFETAARAFVLKLQREGFGPFAENFRAAFGID